MKSCSFAIDMKKRLLLFVLLLFQFLLSGCVTDITKLQIGEVKSVNLVSVSLTSSDVLLTADVKNLLKKDVTILEAQVISKDIEDLSIELGEQIMVPQGNNTMELPLKVNYSLGSALALVGRIQNGTFDSYTFIVRLRFSKGNHSAPATINFRKKVSKSELKHLISRIRK